MILYLKGLNEPEEIVYETKSILSYITCENKSLLILLLFADPVGSFQKSYVSFPNVRLNTSKVCWFVLVNANFGILKRPILLNYCTNESFVVAHLM